MATNYESRYGGSTSTRYGGNTSTRYGASPFSYDKYIKENAPASRSTLNEVFDLLSIGQYASAGLIGGTIEGGLNEGVSRMGKGIAQGLSIAPIWEGYKEPADYNFGDVIKNQVGEADTKLGRIGQGALGFAGDVLLDPLTYVGVGALGKIAQGTQKAGKLGKHFSKEILEETSARLAKEGMTRTADEFAQMAAKGRIGQLSKEAAEDVVRHINPSASVADIAKDADELVKTFDKLGGVKDTTRNLDINIKYMPFGEKLFGKEVTSQGIDLLTDAQLRKIGDKTIAPFMNDITEAFYSTTLGKAFSTKTGMRRLAATNPEQVYKTMKFMQKAQASGLDKTVKVKAFEDFLNINEIKTLTSRERKSVIKALENPTSMKFVNAQTSETFSSYDEAIQNFVDRYRSSADDIADDISQTMGDMAAQRDEAYKGVDDAFKAADEADNAAHNAQADIVSNGGKVDNAPSVDEGDIVIGGVQETAPASKQDFLNSMTAYMPGKIDTQLSNFDYQKLRDIHKTGGVEAVQNEVEKNILQYSGYNRLVNQGASAHAKTLGYTDGISGLREAPRLKMYDLIADAKGSTLFDAELKELDLIADAELGVDDLTEFLVQEGHYTAEEIESALKPIYDDMDKVDLWKGGMLDHASDWKQGNRAEFLSKLESNYLENSGNAIEELTTERLNEVNRIKDELQDIKFDDYREVAKVGDAIDDAKHGYAGVLDDNGAERVAREVAPTNSVQSKLAKDAAVTQQEAIDKAQDVKDLIDNVFYPNKIRKTSKTISSHTDEIVNREKFVKATASRRKELVSQKFEPKEITQIIDDEFTPTGEMRVGEGERITDLIDEQFKLSDDIIKADAEISKSDAIDSVTSEAKAMQGPNIGGSSVLQDADIRKMGEKYIKQGNVSGMSDELSEKTWALRNAFIKMGLDATDAGLLHEDAFKAMKDVYFPRKLTAKGVKLFNIKEGDKPTKSTFVTDLFGFKQSTKASFQKARTADIYDMVDFNDAKGVEAFSEDVASVYMSRAIENEEAIYQANFAKELVRDLGVDTVDNIGRVVPLQEGHAYGVAYSDMMKSVNDGANARVQAILKADPQLSNSLNANKATFNEWYKDALTKERKIVGNQLGFDFDNVGDWAKPVVELNGNQAQSVLDMGGEAGSVKQIHQAQVDLFNHKRNVEVAKKSNQLLNVYDKFLNLYKQQVTALLPGWHARNAVSNQFQNFLSIGSDVTNPTLQKEAYRAMRKQNLDEVFFDDVTYGQLYDEAVSTGLLESGYFNVDFGGESKFASGFDEINEVAQSSRESKSFGDIASEVKEQSNINPLSKDFIGANVGRTVGSFVEERDRLLHYMSLRKSGMEMQAASDEVNHFLFDYDDLTVFEHTVMKRVVPFYTWMKKNTSLQYEQLMQQPETYRNLSKVLSAIEGTTPEDERIYENERPKYADDWLQLSGGDDNLFMNPAQPYQDINNVGLSVGEILGRLSPAIKAPIELATNKNAYFGSEITGEGTEVKDRVNYILDYLEVYQSGRKLVNANRSSESKWYDTLNRTSGVKLGSF